MARGKFRVLMGLGLMAPGWLALTLAPARMALPAPAAAGADGPAYQYRRASPDGIGKFYYGREIAHVMGYAGVSWLERPERDVPFLPPAPGAPLRTLPQQPDEQRMASHPRQHDPRRRYVAVR